MCVLDWLSIKKALTNACDFLLYMARTDTSYLCHAPSLKWKACFNWSHKESGGMQSPSSSSTEIHVLVSVGVWTHSLLTDDGSGETPLSTSSGVGLRLGTSGDERIG